MPLAALVVDRKLMVKHLVISEDWSPKVGGAHFWVENTYRRWPDQVEVLTATRLTFNAEQVGATKPSVNSCESISVKRILAPVHTISFNSKCWRSIFENVLKVRRSLSRKSTSIHCKAYFPEGLVGALAKRSSDKVSKLIVYAHGEEINVAKSSRLLRLIAKWVYDSADLVIANSRNTERMVQSLVGAATITVIHPGVDVARVQSAGERRSQVRSKYSWSEDSFVVLTIARLEPRKNVVRVIDALHRLREEGETIRYVVVGRGEALPAIQAKIKEHGAQDWVTLIEHVTEYEKFELLNAADVFVMASISHGLMVEGFGIVFLEAAAAGLLSVSGNDGGQCEAVLNGVTGFNVDGNSTDEIRGGIIKILRDRDNAFMMQAQAKAWAEHNDWSEVVAKTIRAVG